MPRKGFLGLTQTPAKVRIYKEFPDPVEKKPVVKAEPKPAAKPAPAPVIKEEKIEKAEVIEKAEAPAEPEEKRVYDLGGKVEAAESYINDVIKAMDLGEITISTTVVDNVINFKLEGDVSGAAIGRRGETLDALQYLTGLAANRLDGDYVRIVLDSGNYRDKRRHTLEQLAKKLANSVLKSGRSTTLEPMNPYERRIIHSTVADIEGVTSSSIGEEPNRCVVISSTNPRPQRSFDGHQRGGRGGRGGRNNDRRGGRNGDRRGPRREKPVPYQESSIREVAPAEAANQPLYGKIEL
ncbi:MAG: KH domain-containing protein [Oscillospiraceae bacterium]|nr:KH domain-containing protein [Oscillospiraceae bacterium]